MEAFLNGLLDLITFFVKAAFWIGILLIVAFLAFVVFSLIVATILMATL